MKNKSLFIFVYVSLLLFLPGIVLADQSQQQAIEQLRAKIAALQAQLQQLLEQKPPTQPPGLVISTFARDLGFGIVGDPDVSKLQEFLTQQGVYSGPVTGNFFMLTREAVRKFQAAHGIATTGYFGPLTRAAANTLISQPAQPICPRFLEILPCEAGHQYQTSVDARGCSIGVCVPVVTSASPPQPTPTAPTTTPTTATPAPVVLTAGDLTIQLDASNPTDGNVVAGTNNVIFTVLKITNPTDVDVTLTSMTFISDAAADEYLQNVALATPEVNLGVRVGHFNRTSTTFSFNYVIQANSAKTFIIRGNVPFTIPAGTQLRIGVSHVTQKNLLTFTLSAPLYGATLTVSSP